MTAGRNSHPDVESLDAYADGERRDLVVDRHVRDCGDCAESVAALRQVRSELAGLSDLAMPDDVASRIRAALAADAAAGARSDGSSAAAAGARTVRSAGGEPFVRPKRRDSGRAGRMPRIVGSPREWLVAAVCLVAVVAVAVAVDSRGTTTSASEDQAALSTPEAASASGDYGVSSYGDGQSEGRSSAVEPPAPAAAPTSLPFDATGAAPGAGAGPGADSATGAAVPGPVLQTTVSSSDVALVDAEFASHAREILAGSSTAPARSAVVTTVHTFVFAGAVDVSATGWDTLTSPGAARCYDGLLSRSGGELLAVDQVRYLAGQALFVVFSKPDDAASVVVVVVDVDCAAGTGATVPLRTVTVDRL